MVVWEIKFFTNKQSDTNLLCLERGWAYFFLTIFELEYNG